MELPGDQLLSAFISLLVGTLLGREITRWLYRPRVFIRYKDITPLITGDGVHWSIKVANLGRTVATSCKGTITIDDLSSEDLMAPNEAYENESLPKYQEEGRDLSFPREQIIDPRYFREISSECLSWAALGNPSVISINPGITEILDVFKVQHPEKGGYISMPTELGWRRLRARVKAKDLSGKIMICPSNEFPTLILFRLSFDEEGQSHFVVETPPFFERFQKWFLRERYYFG